MTDHELWKLATNASQKGLACCDAVFERFVAAHGLDRSTWVLLSTIGADERASLTMEDLNDLHPFTATAFLDRVLTEAARSGYLLEQPDSSYSLSGAGRERTEALSAELHAAMAATDPLCPLESARLAQLLGKVVAAGVTTPGVVPRFGRVMYRLLPRRNPPFPYALRCGVYLNAFRSDAHRAAWSQTGLAPLSLQVLTSLWRDFDSWDVVARRLQDHGHPPRALESAVIELRTRGLVRHEDGRILVTGAGRALRQEIEVQTESLFFAPWETLSLEEKDELARLFTRLDDALPGGDGT